MNRPFVRTLQAASAGLLASAAFAVPAQATISISSFSLTPSTTQAGGTTTAAGPNLNIAASFSTTNGDSPDNLLLSLAPGVLANPSVVPFCSVANFQADNCASSSQIGTGTVTGTAPSFGTTLNLPATAYLIQPAGSEIADVGLIVTFFDYPVATQVGPVNVRNSPTVGINIPLNGLPNTIEGVPVQLSGINLTLSGAANGQTFTRNPTSCSPAATSITVNSYGAPSTNQSASSSFTPTGCSTLPYAPTITGTVSKDASDSGIGITASISSSYNQADSQSINLTFPHSASPNLGALLADQCTPATTGNPWAACAVAGTATVTTPLLSNPLAANVYVEQHTNALPTLEIVIPAPFNITLTGTPILTGTSVQALVANVPDIPITNLLLTLPGGTKSLFLGGVHLCNTAQSFGGTFTSWSGVTATPSSAATVSGCPATAATTTSSSTLTSAKTLSSTTQSHAVASGTGAAAADRSTGQVSYSGLAGAKPKVMVAVGGGRKTGAIKSVTLSLPAGFSVSVAKLAQSLRVTVNGKPSAFTARLVGGRLVVSFARSGKVAFITLGAPALSVRSHRSGKLTLTATLHRASGRNVTLHLSSNPH